VAQEPDEQEVVILFAIPRELRPGVYANNVTVRGATV